MARARAIIGSPEKRLRESSEHELLADVLIMQFGGERFTWGSANIQDAGEVRKRYIESLQAADSHDLGPLLAFARS
jgi:hypothetical protein